MKLEDQVISLELAKKLKALNVKQESVFWWTGDDESGMIVVPYDERRTYPSAVNFSAFTVAELLQILGSNFGRLEYNTHSEFKTGVAMYYAYEKNEMRNINASGRYPHDALAELIIKLHANGERN